MGKLRVLTWNSGGESDNRGDRLVEVVNKINNDNRRSNPVQIIAIQEARVSAGGEIRRALKERPPFKGNFETKYIDELDKNKGQKYRNGKNKAYLVSYMKKNRNPEYIITKKNELEHVSLSPSDDLSLREFLNPRYKRPKKTIDEPVPTKRPKRSIAVSVNSNENAANNMRAPVYQLFEMKSNRKNFKIHFYTWHVPHKRNWGSVDIPGSPITTQGPGLAGAILIFQETNSYKSVIQKLGKNDLVILAGDLNLTRADLNEKNMFGDYEGTTDNLSSILAYSKSANLKVIQDASYSTNEHAIVSTNITW